MTAQTGMAKSREHLWEALTGMAAVYNDERREFNLSFKSDVYAWPDSSRSADHQVES